MQRYCAAAGFKTLSCGKELQFPYAPLKKSKNYAGGGGGGVLMDEKDNGSMNRFFPVTTLIEI